MKPLVLIPLAALLAHGGEADALRIDSAIRERHMPYSTVMDPWLKEPGSTEITGYTRCGDSAIWTGHYLAAEAYRYAVTRSPEARANVMEALNGIRKLVDVTGADVLARCAVPVDSPWASGIISEESIHGIRYGVVDGITYAWAGDTSRDQYSGVFFGLTATWNLIPETEVQGWVSTLATRMLNRLQQDNWLVRMPEGEITTTFIVRPDQQLSLLKLGRRCNPNRFESSYKTMANLSAQTVIIPIALECQDPYDSYSKFNLDHINLYNLLTSGDNWFVRRSYVNAFDILRKTTGDHQNAFFDIVDNAVNGHDAVRDQRIRDNLRALLHREGVTGWVDLRSEYPACDGSGDHTCEVIPVSDRVPTDFLWQRSPFQLYGGVYPNIESSGLDYILPYWMARYYGVIGPADE